MLCFVLRKFKGMEDRYIYVYIVVVYIYEQYLNDVVFKEDKLIK